MTESKSDIHITIWDSDSDPSRQTEQVYCWSGQEEKGLIHSLQRYVEMHGERLRDKYLAWVHDLGESRIGEKRLIDHLAFDDGLSYWWMTLFVEKSLYKSPINYAIRLIAIEEIMAEQKPTKLQLVSSNSVLNEALSGLCKNLNVAYEWKRLPGKSPLKLSLKSFYCALPYSAQALIGLGRHIWRRWSLKKAEKTSWFGGDQSLFLCSYFFHIAPDLAEEGSFHSHYWDGLHDFMRKLGISGNWLQLYFPHNAVPSPHVALKWAQRFNRKRQEQGFHTFLDSYLSWGVVLSVLKRWLKLRRITWGLGKIKQAFRPHGSQLSLWPLMREDWHTSLCGRVAIDNLLWIELFSKALSDLPHQKMGLYLCENQSWERALIHAWRKHGHGQLIAVAHATVRFWDLRYFTDIRTIQSPKPYSMPQPDLTALNGKTAVDAYLSVGYPKKSIVECEALRYSYLGKAKTVSRKEKRAKGINVLVLGEYMPSHTIEMLQLLEEAQRHITVFATYTMKPHPNYLVNPEDYPSLNLKVVMDHLEKILHDFDVVYSADKTSAAVDVYVSGLQVVVKLDSAELNFSPLRGQQDVCFVNTPEELAEALQMKNQNVVGMQSKRDFFFLDPEFPRWRKLLTPVSLP